MMLKTFLMAMVPIIESRGAIPWCWNLGAALIAVGTCYQFRFSSFLRDVFAWMRKKSDKLNSEVLSKMKS